LIRKHRKSERDRVWFDDIGVAPYWHRSGIEVNAHMLRLLSAVGPRGEDAAGLARALAAHRPGGTWWYSTRDTALVVQALAEHLVAAGMIDIEGTVTVALDGKPMREVRLTRESLFAADNFVTVSDDRLAPGRHTLTASFAGKGAVQIGGQLVVPNEQDDIPAVGDRLTVRRTYHRLERLPLMLGDTTTRYRRHELSSGDTVTVGDLIEVRLAVGADDTFEFLAMEDPKPGGCEPISLRSGVRYSWYSPFVNVELRTTKTTFFATQLRPWWGGNETTYVVRAEAAGDYRILPARIGSMYDPSLFGHSAGFRLRVREAR
jgi:hypothetical protein